MSASFFSRLDRSLRRAGWNTAVLFWGVALFSVAVWLFIELADDAPEGDYLPWENQILLAGRGGEAERGGPAGLSTVAHAITALGGVTVLVSLTAGVIGFLCFQRRFRTALLMLCATLGGQLLNLALKHSFARERPSVVIHLVQENSSSFPSGHSMASSIFYLMLGMVLARHTARFRTQATLIATAFFISFLIGLSRIYLGVHYPTDVLAGWTAGTAWTLLCCFLAHLISVHRGSPPVGQ